MPDKIIIDIHPFELTRVGMLYPDNIGAAKGNTCITPIRAQLPKVFEVALMYIYDSLIDCRRVSVFIGLYGRN